MRNRISHLRHVLPERHDAESADESTAATNAAWSKSVRKRRAIAARIILRRLLASPKSSEPKTANG